MRFDIIEFTKSYGTAQQLKFSSVPEIVFSGRSNVGKSSLINKLFNRKNLARVSSQPGKTITVNFFKGDGVNFVDLPGYGYAKRSYTEKERWAELMESYFNSERNIDLVVQLIDSRHKPSKDDYYMLDFLKAGNFNTVIVFTKIDKLNKTQRANRLKELEEELKDYPDMKTIVFSSFSGEGVENLRKFIEKSVK